MISKRRMRRAVLVTCLVVVVPACAGGSTPSDEPSPAPKRTQDAAAREATARRIAVRYNRALNEGKCDAAGELGGKNMRPDSSFVQWCEPTDYSPGARGIQLKIRGVEAGTSEVVVSFTQKMCLVGAQTGDPQTRTYSGAWRVDTEAGLILEEERREIGAHFDCEPPLLR